MKLELRKSLGVAVRYHREKHGLTQEQLAERADLHRTYVSDIERGSRNLSLDSMYAIATALQVSLSTLLAAAELDALRSNRENPVLNEAASQTNRS